MQEKANLNEMVQMAKQHLTIPELWKKLGLEGECQNNKFSKSPWRNERTPSLKISKDGMLFKDFGDGNGGDAVTFLQLCCGLSKIDACRKLIELAGSDGMVSENFTKGQPLLKIAKPRQQEIVENIPDTITLRLQLAKIREVEPAAVDRMCAHGLLSFARVNGYDCWVVSDKDKLNAQARRLDGGLIHDKKAKTLKGSNAKWPVGISHSSKNIVLVEGGPDCLAAFDSRSGFQGYSPVCMFGASMQIHPAALPLFSQKKIVIVPHRDQSGQKAANIWKSQLEEYCDMCEIHELPVKDLNDYVRSQQPTP